MQDTEEQRKAVLVLSITRVMAVASVVGFIASRFDPNNKLIVSLGFYVTALSGSLALNFLARRGRIVIAAWGLSIFFFAIIATVTLLFGGLQGHNASSFVAVSLLMSVLVSGRAGVAVAAASVVWCGFVAALDVTGHLPPNIGPVYSPVNAWTAVSVTLVFGALLMSYALESLRRAAAARDDALRRSIQSQKMELVGNLAGGVAHDFNNLLMVITSTSEQLRHTTDDLERLDLLRDLDEATARATLMTRQLLSFGRSQTGAALAPLDVAEATRAFGNMLPRLLGSKISVTLDAPEAFFVRANRAGLEQILLNLAVNARDAMPDGGSLRISVSGDDGHVRLDFADSGVGMSAATLEQIFQPFFTTRSTGTGLGLATVRERVTQFGGEITVESSPGKGTTFHVVLPRVARPPEVAPSPPRRSPEQVSRSRQRLLLVEDDPRVRKSIAGVLEQSGYEVIAVSNGAEALQLLTAEHRFAGVITDISMPVMDGDALATRLRVVAPQLPVVLLSGNRLPTGTTLDDRHVFVEKPAAREVLLSAVEKVLTARG